MSNSSRAAEHPLVRAVLTASAALDDVAATGADPLYVPTPQKGSLLRELTALAARVRPCAPTSWRLPTTWPTRPQTARPASGWPPKPAPRSARRSTTSASAPAFASGGPGARGGPGRAGHLAAGRDHRPALDALPDTLDAELVAKAEAHLLAEAGQFGPSSAASTRPQGARGRRPRHRR